MDIVIREAEPEDFRIVSDCVRKLLLELEPDASDEIEGMGLPEITHDLLRLSRIAALLSTYDGKVIGIITLHECAAIYAGGVFGEISELYVEPAFRSQGIGEQLLKAAHQKAKELCWTRLEVGCPPLEKSPGPMRFYEKHGYVATGQRLRCLIAQPALATA